MPSKRTDRKPKTARPPLDPALLREIALRYVERYQTSRARLSRFLRQKIRQRGWAEGIAPPDPDALAEQMAALGYVDDQAFAESRARDMAQRGLGAGRIHASLGQYGIAEQIRADVVEDHDPLQAAIRFARRKRLGPFGPASDDPRVHRRQLAAFARAGHSFEIARRILDAESESELSED